VKSWDVIIVGGGIIGLALSLELRKQNARVSVVERGEPGREASHAAAGMLADSEFDELSPAKLLATASAQMYPEFVHELQDESGLNCDLRSDGTLQYLSASQPSALSHEDLAALEPALAKSPLVVAHIKERSVDPRALTAAAMKAAKHREVEIHSGSEVLEILLSNGNASGVRTSKTTYSAPIVVNCAGAWSGQFGPEPLPTRPVKGQILCVVEGPALRHVIRTEHVYIVPRSDGRILIGSTVEEAGFDKRVDPDTILELRHDAINLVPQLANARILESWAGLRPGTPDGLPILGETSVPGYFIATGHFRDGILLAPITARLMAQLITGKLPDCDLRPFSSSRFRN
jgi:glycine oxidase